MLAGVELTGAERIVAWVSLLLALGVLAVSVDMLTGGWLFGRAEAESEAAADE